MIKVSVVYDHDPADLSPIYLAVVPHGSRPAEESWRPALRDTVDGRRVVWARFDSAAGMVWLRDRSGERQAQRLA